MQIRDHRGFTLIEIAIVLTIVGLIIGGIWLAAATVIDNNKNNALAKDALQVISNTRVLFASQGAQAIANQAGSQFNVSAAYAAGMFPPDMISSASTPGNPIIITPYTTDITKQGFDIQFTSSTTIVVYIFGVPPTVGSNGIGLPSSACTHLLTTLGTASNIQALSITGLGGGPSAWTYGANPIAPISAAQAATECNAPGYMNAVYVYFDVAAGH